MFSISNEELKNKKRKIGKTIKCPHCEKRHKITYGGTLYKDGSRKKNDSLAFYKCGNTTYLAGIDGKVIF